ncbi:integration host factor subunit beta [Alistipes sp. OttesenSCG-928-B03]|nr:integration host factor subunit beta [Alistipes sp. OttesenSCG-928-B03]
MTKAELVAQIAQQTGAEKSVVSNVVESLMDSIRASVTEGESVYLRGFGTFGTKCRAEKKARNITKNTTVIVPACNIPSFKPSKEFAAKIKE